MSSDLYLPESFGDIEVPVLDPSQDPMAHAVLGASSAERWMNCPGSVKMSEGMPNKSSMYAMEGTAAHHLGEFCLNNNCGAQALAGQFMTYRGEIVEDNEVIEGEATVIWEGEPVSLANPAFAINEDMIKSVNLYLETIERRMDWVRETYGEVPQLLVEKRFNLSRVYPGMFGTNDVSIYLPGVHLDVMDYKHGRGKVVEIANNPQLKYYGLGGLLELCQDEFDEPTHVNTAVIQPRAAHKDGFVRWATYQSADISVKFRRELVAAAIATEQPDAKLQEGPWCFFCRGKSRCPKIVGKFAKLTSVDLYDLSEEELTGDPKALVKRAVQAALVSPEKTGQVLAFLPIFKSFVEELEAIAVEMRVEHKVHVPGFKLGRKDTKRKYRDEDAVGRILFDHKIPAKDAYNKPKLKTPLQMKNLLEKEHPEVWAAINEQVFKPEGAFKLVPLDDDQPEVVLPGEEGDFDTLDASDLMVPGSGQGALPAPEDFEL